MIPEFPNSAKTANELALNVAHAHATFSALAPSNKPSSPTKWRATPLASAFKGGSWTAHSWIAQLRIVNCPERSQPTTSLQKFTIDDGHLQSNSSSEVSRLPYEGHLVLIRHAWCTKYTTSKGIDGKLIAICQRHAPLKQPSTPLAWANHALRDLQTDRQVKNSHWSRQPSLSSLFHSDLILTFPCIFFFLFILSSTYILLDSPCLNVLGLLQCLVLQERYLQEAWTAQRCWDPQMNKLLSGQLPEILKNMHNLFPVWSIFFRCQATPLSQA